MIGNDRANESVSIRENLPALLNACPVKYEVDFTGISQKWSLPC